MIDPKKQMKQSGLIFTLFSAVLFFSCAGSQKSTAKKTPAYLEPFAEAYRQNPRQTNLEWFKNAKYGMFIHYGLYSLLENGEWVQYRSKPPIPVATYAKLADRFTADQFDAEKITDLAIAAKMKYITITTKHHDGFALFNTKARNFNVMNSPAKRDLIKELYEACERKKLGLFLYYSYAADWSHPYFLPHEASRMARPAYKEAQPEYLYKNKKDFQKYIDFAHQQITELLTQYPNIAGIWFDPIMGVYHQPEAFPIDATYAMIRRLSPHALISFKQGANGTEDFMAPERGGAKRVGEGLTLAEKVYALNKNKPTEICNTMQPHSWGYSKSDDGKHKTADDVLKLLKDAKVSNANLLLNIGPKGDGSIPEEDIKALTEAGKRIAEVYPELK